MTPEHWQLIARLYHDALAREADARPTFLGSKCGAPASALIGQKA